MTGTGAWATYNGLLRELHAVRVTAEDRTGTTEEILRARTDQVESFAEQVRDQESRIVRLAQELRKPVRFTEMSTTKPADQLPWDEAAADLTEQLHAADLAVEDTEHFGHRPQLLPHWPAWARNAAIYFAYSLPNTCVNWGLWLFYGHDTTDREFTAVAWGCCFWPIAVVVAGIATIRALAVPRLKPRPKQEFEQPTEGAVLLSVPLGFVISLGTSGASIAVLWLFSSFLG